MSEVKLETPPSSICDEPSINNYKISFRLQCPDIIERLKKTPSIVKWYHNFAVLRSTDHVYTIFFSGFVNATKISDLDRCIGAIHHLQDLLHIEHETLVNGSYAVDNVSASGRFMSCIGLSALKTTPRMHVRFNPDRFAGASVKYVGEVGTAVLFKSGCYIIVGSKNVDQVNSLFKLLKEELIGNACLLTSRK
jgi:hypothetical protein